MVCPDFELVVGAFQEMVPILQSLDDRQHLLVMDLIVPLHGIDAFGVVSDRMPLVILRRLLREDCPGGKVRAVSFDLEGSGLVWEHQNQSGDHVSPNGLKC